MITSSQFYQDLLNLRNAADKGINNLQQKGITIGVNSSVDEICSKISMIEQNFILQGNVAIVTADIPNTSISLMLGDSTIETKDNSLGGVVTFILATAPAESTVYTINSYLNGELFWTNNITIAGAGTYYCKSGKLMNDYTEDQWLQAFKNNYGKYMFNFWDFRYLESFMGSTSTSYTKFYYVDSENVYDTYGNHVAGTFMLDRTSSSYAQWTSNNNGISWEGSLIRQNCLPANSTYYTYDDSVNSSTEGTYYIWDNTTSTWQSKILPSDYQDNIKYFSQNVSIEDGVFWTGLPENIRQNIVQVNNSTWTGYGGPVTNSSTANSNNDIIISEDFLWIPSDGQIFGNSDRYSNAANSKFTLEGNQLSAFTTYHENRFYSGNSRWLRSPYTTSSSYFKYWNLSGYSSFSSASYSSYVGLCFCL